MLGSIFANVTFLITILKNPRLKTNLNLLILGVTTSDIFSAFILQPMDFIYMLYFPKYPYPKIVSILWNGFFYSYTTMSACSLCAVSMERFISIRFALNYKSIVTRKVIYLSIAMTWIYGGVTFVAMTIVQFMVSHRHNFSESFLLPNYFIIAVYIINVFIPLSISFCAAVHLTIIALKHKRQLTSINKKTFKKVRPQDTTELTFADASKTNLESSESNASLVTKSPQKQGTFLIKRAKWLRSFRTIRLIVVLCVCFLCCGLPHSAMELIERFSETVERTCDFQFSHCVFWWISYWNSVANVFAYITLNQDLKKAYKNSFTSLINFFSRFNPMIRSEL